MDLRATYRLQLTADFDLHAARRLVPMLRELGISHLYLSPVMQARAGSTHGYDVVDPTRVSDDLGGEDALRALAREGLGVVVDFVPNHMAADDANPFWCTDRERVFDVRADRRRRFFDVDDLVGVRVEDPEVFELTHAKLLELVGDGVIDGVRIDHVDGLADPAAYLERLRVAGVGHVWVEKILEPGEPLRPWPVEGTTGYEFANDALALFVDRRAEAAFTALAREPRPFHDVAHQAKREQVATTFAREVDWLRSVAGDDEVARGIEEGLAALPVYRTYVRPTDGTVDELDRTVLADVPSALRRRLTLDEPGPPELVVRFQQTTGAVMAKGVEDTAFYRYVRLLALNEVGGDPGRFGATPSEVHEANAVRARDWPRALLTGQTHDTKRSPDVRARLAALTWLPERWVEEVGAWHDLTAGFRTPTAPDWSEELFVYQTLVGTWPIDDDRLSGYLTKALREMKRTTSWINPDEQHEARVREFACGITREAAFRDRFDPFVAEVAALGERISLGLLVLRLTAPGVPDCYQGDELWDRSLVDPDNRRPVDFARVRALLDEARAGAPPTRESAKVFTLHRLLDLRRRRPDAFGGSYDPLTMDAPTTFAYRRGGDVVVRVPVRDASVERDPPSDGDWIDVLEPLRSVFPSAPAVFERT